MKCTPLAGHFGDYLNGAPVTNFAGAVGKGRAIAWDAENRPGSNTYGGQTTTFTYGPAGERVKVVGSATTVYVGDSYEKNLSTGVVTTYYTFGGRRVALRQGASTYWLHPDHLGSTALVTDASGDKAGERRYYPWGALRSPQGGDVHTKRLYTGQLFDESTGLYYYGARYYDVVIGRFFSPDTLVPGTGNPQNLNRFSYAANSPTNHTDPSGHCIPGENYPGGTCLASLLSPTESRLRRAFGRAPAYAGAV